MVTVGWCTSLTLKASLSSPGSLGTPLSCHPVSFLAHRVGHALPSESTESELSLGALKVLEPSQRLKGLHTWVTHVGHGQCLVVPAGLPVPRKFPEGCDLVKSDCIVLRNTLHASQSRSNFEFYFGTWWCTDLATYYDAMMLLHLGVNTDACVCVDT